MLIFALVGLLFAISGTTAMNMVFDRDLDAVMERTKKRPLPTGTLNVMQASVFGWFLIIAGSAINFWISAIYGLIVLLGVFFDFVIYTIWLKRRSPWSIAFGGLSGGMPILAGRVLATGNVDLVGIAFATAILLWIPTHILTLAMNHSKDYKLAGVPTFPNVFGFEKARYFIVLSNVLAAGIMLAIGYNLEITHTGIMAMRIGGILLLILSLKMLINPSKKTNFSLFKFASLYMSAAMLIFAL